MIVDAHVHVFPGGIRRDLQKARGADQWFARTHPEGRHVASVDELLIAMEEDAVDRSVVMGWPFADPALCRESNDYAAREQRSHPDRIIGFGIVNPAAPDAADEVARCAGLGLRGIGELNADAQGWSWDGPEIARVVATAVAHDMVLNLHVSEPLGHAFSGRGTAWPWRLVSWTDRFPEARTIAAHLGGGLPFYAEIPGVRAACHSLWLDLAAVPFLYGPQAYRHAMEACGDERLLYASDYPLLRRGRYQTQLEAAGLSESATRALLGGNAAKLLL